MGKITTEDVIKRCVDVHGDRYDYSKVNYVNNKTKLCIICREHGEFYQYLYNHLKGCGCPSCSNNKRLTTQEYVSKLKEKYNDINVSFDKVEYVNNHTPIKLVCPIHGEWETWPSSILKNCECPECQKERLHDKYTLGKSEFIKRSTLKHNGKYDYSKVKYVDGKTKVCIICPEHGEFWQRPTEHLQGKGCSKCGQIEMWNKRGRMTTEKMIEKFNSVHGDKYDYSKVKYVDAHTKVCIICPEHGEFWQMPYSHLGGCGCPECGKIVLSKKFSKTTNQFIIEATKVHGNEFDYSKVDYKNSSTKVEIGCPKHGFFWQNPMSHLKGIKCPMCYAEKSISDKEISLRNFITELCDNKNVRFNVRNIIQPLELDIVNDDKKIAIEYDGLYWHSDEKIKDTTYHLNKTKKCENVGYKLIHIFEDEWDYKCDIVKSRLENIFGKTPNKVFARKCVIKEIDSKISKEFLDKNHIHGSISSSISFGLFYNDDLVSVMTFDKLRKNLSSKDENGAYELTSFCNKLHYNVVGGASKMLKHFIKTYNPTKIISYVDKRWSDGEMYFSLGFKYTHDSKPSYFYTLHGKTRENRFKYRKDILVNEGFDKDKSEEQIMKERGYHKIYDCGCMVFEKVL